MTQQFSDDDFTQPDGAEVARPAPASAPEGSLEAALAKIGGKFLGKMPAATPASEPSAAPAESASVNQFHDHAFDILTAAPDMSDDQRADAWSHYHDAKNSKDLAQRLGTIDAPNDIKQALWSAKQATDPVPTQADKVVDAIQKMAAMDSKTLSVAENNPNVLRALTGKG